VDAVRHLVGFRQIGHLGTLDPLATGGPGAASSDAPRALCSSTPGAANATPRASASASRPTPTIPTAKRRDPTYPPFWSAPPWRSSRASASDAFRRRRLLFPRKKVKGRPAYELARKKQPVELKSVDVELFEFQLAEIDGAVARFNIECSSGTYVRSLAHEMGEKLVCGAHLAEITRTAVGEFSLEQAVTLEELAEATRAGAICRLSHPPSITFCRIFRASMFCRLSSARVRHGTKFNISVSQIQPGRAEPPPGATSELDGGEPRPPRLRVFSQQKQPHRHRRSGGSPHVSAGRGIRTAALAAQGLRLRGGGGDGCGSGCWSGGPGLRTAPPLRPCGSPRPAKNFFGIGLLKQRFPHARAVARPDIVEAMRHELDPPYFNSFWNSRFPGQLPEQLVVAEAFEGNTMELEGHELVMVDTGYTDTALSTSLHVPSIDLVAAGDVAYNGVHPYMAEGNPQSWAKWIAALDKLELLKPRAVIAGHKRPENDDHPRIIEETRSYFRDFPAPQRGRRRPCANSSTG